MEACDILIIGGGAAGISAAKAAYGAGCRSILLVDNRTEPGGVLRQCLHRGFDLDLNGPEYIRKLTLEFPDSITLWCRCTVAPVYPNRTARVLGPKIGERFISFRQLILATGCREIPIGTLPIAGTRPAGIYTAGQMQEMMNLYGFQPRGPVMILGSGDLGLIMADQIAKAGIAVTLIEHRDQCGGMARNQRCLQYPNVRLRCSTTISEIFGDRELDSVQLSNGEQIPCKTLLIAVGLQPERDVIHGLGEPDWLQLCGNCRKVHAMVEAAAREGTQAGIAAWTRIRGNL